MLTWFVYCGVGSASRHAVPMIIYTNMGLDPLTMMDWYCMDNDDSLYLSGCQSTKQRHAFCNRII